jgi:DNA-binding IclR family transcriptional regulator
VETDLEPKNVVASIFKAARLLEVFTLDRAEVSLGEFTRETGFNKTTVYRLLQTMVAAGWLMRAESGSYRLGYGIMTLGSIARADLDIREQSVPVLRRLATETGDTAFLMIPGPHGAVTVETVEGTNPVRFHGVGVGTVLPYHVAAGPVVLAAFDPSLEAALFSDERKRFTAATTVAEGALRAKLEAVRKSGYSVSMEDYVNGVAAVAAPVMGPNGVPVAALSVGGPAYQFAEGVIEATIRRVVEGASELSVIAQTIDRAV